MRASLVIVRRWALVAALAVPAPALAQAVPPDVVRLTDGGMVRGTILEHDPDSHVLVQLPSGERRRIAASEVRWAGPAAELPESVDVPPAPSPVELRPATVRFRANARGVRVYYLPDPILEDDGRGGVRVRLAEPHRYTVLCDAPCDRELPRAHFALAFSRGGGALVRLRDPFGVNGHTGVRVRWDDRSAERTAGLWTLILGIPAGVLLGVLPITVDRLSGGQDLAYAFTAGAGALVADISIAVGVTLFLSRDGASFRVQPLPDDAEGLFRTEWD